MVLPGPQVERVCEARGWRGPRRLGRALCRSPARGFRRGSQVRGQDNIRSPAGRGQHQPHLRSLGSRVWGYLGRGSRLVARSLPGLWHLLCPRALPLPLQAQAEKHPSRKEARWIPKAPQVLLSLGRSLRSITRELTASCLPETWIRRDGGTQVEMNSRCRQLCGDSLPLLPAQAPTSRNRPYWVGPGGLSQVWGHVSWVVLVHLVRGVEGCLLLSPSRVPMVTLSEGRAGREGGCRCPCVSSAKGHRHLCVCKYACGGWETVDVA